MYILEIMENGTSHGFETAEDARFDGDFIVLMDRDRETGIYNLDKEVAFVDETDMTLVEWTGNYTGLRPMDPRTGRFVNRIYTNPRWGR